jgi:hypothetical protein
MPFAYGRNGNPSSPTQRTKQWERERPLRAAKHANQIAANILANLAPSPALEEIKPTYRPPEPTPQEAMRILKRHVAHPERELPSKPEPPFNPKRSAVKRGYAKLHGRHNPKTAS